MSYITITAVTFATAPTGAMWVSFSYRKQGDTVWIEVNPTIGSQLVPLSGILNTPLTISSLLPATNYEVKAQPKFCAAAEYIQVIATLSAACPAITDIGVIVSN